MLDMKPILEITDLEKHYPLGRGLIGSLLSQKEQIVRAMDGVSFSIKNGEILGLVGESGSGKSTTALSILGLATPTKGSILFNGQNVVKTLKGKNRLALRRKMQIFSKTPTKHSTRAKPFIKLSPSRLKFTAFAATKRKRNRVLSPPSPKPDSNHLKPTSTVILMNCPAVSVSAW